MYTLCLNMIVKDEAHCIVETLTQLCSKLQFDYWVISDTGSTDNTQELIKTFFQGKIEGELHEDPWVDFGHNRSLALSRAHNKTDYLWIFDADDSIVGNLVLPDQLDYDSYSIQFGSVIKHARALLVNNRKPWRFLGVLHEYLQCSEPIRGTTLKGDYYIVSGRHGNRSKDPQKYKKDALLLQSAYEVAHSNKDPIFNRYSFYCANSFRDAGDDAQAIHWYKHTLTLDNWDQEKYVCCLNLYKLHVKQNTEEQGIYYLLEAYKHDKTRVEGMYHLIQHYCIKNQNELAFSFYSLIQPYYEAKFEPPGRLFVDEPIYAFYLPYYMIIVCERLKKYEVGIKMYDIIFEKKMLVGEWWLKNLLFNSKFFGHDASFAGKLAQYKCFLKGHNLCT